MTTNLLDPFTLAFHQDPEPIWADLRQTGGPIRVATPDGTAWLLSRYRDVRAALTDSRLSPCARHALGDDYRGYDLPPAFEHNIINAEPADHRRLRQLVSPTMNHITAERLAPDFRTIARRLLGAPGPGNEFDLVRDFIGPYVADALATWLGLSDDLRQPYSAWAMRLVGPEWATLRGRDTLPTMASLTATLADIGKPSSTTTVGRVLRHHHDGRMTASETSAMLFYLLFVWYEVCVNAIASTLATAGTIETVRDTSKAWRRPIAEALRLHTPQPLAYRRFATEDVQWRGTTIPRGQTVLVALAAANTDPSVFARPPLRRSEHPSGNGLTYGHGPHRCPGQPLANVLIREALIAAADTALAVDARNLVWTTSLRTRGPRQVRARTH